jgi:hypothetical protein
MSEANPSKNTVVKCLGQGSIPQVRAGELRAARLRLAQ